MAVVSHAQKNEIESRNVGRRAGGLLPENPLIVAGGTGWIGGFPHHPTNPFTGDVQWLEERLLRHRKIAFGVIRRHAPFIPEEEGKAIPGAGRAPFGAGQSPIERLGRGAAGKGHETPALSANGLGCEFAEQTAGLRQPFLTVLADNNLRNRCHARRRRRDNRRAVDFVRRRTGAETGPTALMRASTVATGLLPKRTRTAVRP